MPKYRKKPIVVDAEQFHLKVGKWPEGVLIDRLQNFAYIETLEGRMRVQDGDWIVTGIKGEKYPVKDKIFKETYEPMNDDVINMIVE